MRIYEATFCKESVAVPEEKAWSKWQKKKTKPTTFYGSILRDWKEGRQQTKTLKYS